MFSVASSTLVPPRTASSSSIRSHGRKKKVLHLSSSTDLLIEEEYGEEAALVLTQMLLKLSKRGYPRAELKSTTVFDRIMGGLCWLLQRIVSREHAECGRVQWDLLFQSHVKMKPRLGLAQEIVRRIERLAVECPIPIQPHQLLLQDFSDIGALSRVLDWLLDQDEASEHLSKSSSHLNSGQRVTSTRAEALNLQQQFCPKRRRKIVVVGTLQDHEETEEVAVQRCLLEYGERINAAVLTGEQAETDEESEGRADVDEALLQSQAEENTPNGRKELLASLASQAKAKSKARMMSSPALVHGMNGKEADSAFAVEYQQAERQALREEQKRLREQKKREAELLQQMQVIPQQSQSLELDTGESMLIQVDNVTKSLLTSSGASSFGAVLDASSAQQRTQLHANNQKLQAQIADLEAKANDVHQALAEVKALKSQRQDEDKHISSSMAMLNEQIAVLEATEANQTMELKPLLSQLRQLVMQNEELKKQEQLFKADCRQQAQELEDRLNQLRLQDTSGCGPDDDEETLRLLEIEQLYEQMAGKLKEMKQLLANQTHAVNNQLRLIDEIPSRVELIQYEKRFVELYEEMALTLDETRKFFCVYNTLKQTHQFLEKEISLINSIVSNFNTALSSKSSSDAFFKQIHGIISQVTESVAKQKQVRQEKQMQVDTLDSKYQLLLEKERVYVKAIGEFQRECELNEKLVAEQSQSQREEIRAGQREASISFNSARTVDRINQS